jgi:Spy/CpxP family protein refolding chaperone
LGSQHGKTIKIEKCVGDTGKHEGEEVKIIRKHPPGPKHKIMHGTSESEGMVFVKECLESCGDDCGADCTHKIVKKLGGSCRSECTQSCVGGHGSGGNMWIAKAHCDVMGPGGNMWNVKAHKNASMSHCTSSGTCHCGPDCLLMHASVLGLTDDQQNELKELQFAAKKKMIDLKAAMQKEQLEMQELMSADDLNASAIKRQLDAVASAHTDVKFEMISTMIAARKVLTKEQRELLKEKLQMHGGGCCEGHSGMGMQLIESCHPQIIGGHKTIDVIVDGDKEGECIKVIEIEE